MNYHFQFVMIKSVLIFALKLIGIEKIYNKPIKTKREKYDGPER